MGESDQLYPTFKMIDIHMTLRKFWYVNDLLKHNLPKNVCNLVTFFDKREFKRLYMALMIRNEQKKKQVKLMLDSFTPSDINFQTILMAKWFWQIFCHKKSTLLDHSYLKYALIS